jgi:NADP-dependent 3-hydroxy acid dehydrogenase YdfG
LLDERSENKVVIATGEISDISEVTAKVLGKHRAKVILNVPCTHRLETIVKEIYTVDEIAEYQILDVMQHSQLNTIVQFAQHTLDLGNDSHQLVPNLPSDTTGCVIFLGAGSVNSANR